MTNKREYIRPWGEFEMDEATGLPALPEGHFWRVTRPSRGYWQVQLRKRTWYGSRCVAWTSSRYEMTASKVKELAGYVLEYKFKGVPVHENHFTDYAQETVEDCGYIPADLPGWIANAIDWEKVADAYKEDYTDLEFRGVTYWARA